MMQEDYRQDRRGYEIGSIADNVMLSFFWMFTFHNDLAKSQIYKTEVSTCSTSLTNVYHINAGCLFIMHNLEVL